MTQCTKQIIKGAYLCIRKIKLNQEEIMFGSSNQKEKIRSVRRNDILDRGFDNSHLQAYEKYIMAEFIDPSKAEDERKSAIQSLIPGTLHFYHLYFLDQVKRGKKLKEFSKDDKALWDKFDQKFGQTPQFYEVEAWLNVLHPLGELKDFKKSKDMIKYLLDHYLPHLKSEVDRHNRTYHDEGNKPEHMRKDAHESSQSENEDMDSTVSKNTDKFRYDDFFKTREEILKLRQNWLDQNTSSTKKKYHIDVTGYEGFENDLNWKKTRPEYAMNIAQHRMQEPSLFEIENKSFFDKLAEHIVDLKKIHTDNKKLKGVKFEIPQGQELFTAMTIDQLDLIKSLLSARKYDIMQDNVYVSAYFSKIFVDELSAETKELLNDEQKLANLFALYNYATTRKLHKSLIQNLLHEILTLTIKLDDYREDLFKDYLKFPLEMNRNFKQEKVRLRNSKGAQKYSKWQNCLQNVQTNTAQNIKWSYSVSENDVIPKYLEHFCAKKSGSLKDYSDDFSEDYIKSIEKKVQVYLTDKGLIDLADDFSPDEFKRIQDQVILKFKDTNREIFKVEESVTLKLEVKNVPELVIKVFEFNTETYYKKTMQPFDTSINLHGMVPSIQRVELYKEVPKNKIVSRDFVFDELKDKIGLFIIEFMGNGQMSRAVIKKGSLSLVHQSSPAGHIAYIIDANRNICVSDKTGVWIDKKFYPSNKDKNGQIFIPYAKTQQETKVIMIHQDFAQLGNFIRKTETFQFSATSYLNSESLLVGQEAKILIRSRLTINGRKTSLGLCKNTKVRLTIGDFKSNQTSKQFDLKLKDDEDSFISFQVTPNMVTVSVNIETQVQNSTKNQLENFYASDSFEVKEHSHSNQVMTEFYLKKVRDNYVLYSLGRNGEPQVNEKIKFKARHRSKQSEAYQTMTTDKQGKVMLGHLKDVKYIQAVSNEKNTGESWNVDSIAYDKWTQPLEYHIIEGEAIQFPVNFDSSKELESHQASLVMRKDNQILKNMFKRIKLVKSSCQQYHYLQLEGLEAGNYELKYNFDLANHRETIEITVHKGQYWQGGFILKNNQLISKSQKYDVVELTGVDVKKDQQNLDISIGMKNFNELTRVHVFASQFNANAPLSLWEKLDDSNQDSISLTKFPFAKWKNMFESNNDIGDEIKYVFDRQKRQNQMGNTLDRPSLLMKRNFTKYTTTVDQVVKKGVQYAKHDMQSEVAEIAHRRAAPKMKKKMAESQRFMSRGGGGKKHGSLGPSFTAPLKDIIKDYQNFLAVSPLQLFNLKPDASGKVSIQIQDASNYSQVTIVACDNHSVAQRHLNIQSYLGQEDLPAIPCRDLTLDKKVNPDQTVGLTESREAQNLQQQETVHIEDITSSQVQIVDTLDKVYKVVEQMKSLSLNNQFNMNNDDQFTSFIQSLFLDWPSLDLAQKKTLYSKYTCHEVNIYIKKRDPDFFQKVVRNLVQNKLEKTFVDWYVLDQHELILAKLSCHQDLNQIELCLLVEVCMSKGTPAQKSKVSALVDMYIQSQKSLEDSQHYYKDGNTRIQIFESILKMQSLDQQDLNDIESSGSDEEMEEAKIMEMEEEEDVDMGGCFGVDYDDDESIGISPRAMMFGSSIAARAPGGPPIPGSSAAPQRRMMMQSVQPQMQLKSMEAPMMQNIQPMMQNIQPLMQQQMMIPEEMEIDLMSNNCYNNDNDLFNQFDMEQYQQQIQKNVNEVGFQELEKTSEYMETHYYKKKNANSNKDFYQGNRLIQEYLLYLVEGSKGPFLTSTFIDIGLRYVPFALSIIDLPFESSESYKNSKQPHKFKSDKKRGINITAGGNLILFKKEIKEGNCEIKNDLMMIHRYKLLNGSDDDNEAEDIIMNKPYKCEIIMTNISPKRKTVNLLCQIPNGSLPLMHTKYVDSNQYQIGPYTTEKQEIQFYFPKEGKFEHGPSNISEDLLVTMKSPLKVLNVIKKRIITKVETFRDLMITTPNDNDKKQKIIALIKDRKGLFYDKKFGFDLHDTLWLAANDSKFYVTVNQLLQEKMYEDHKFNLHSFWFLDKEINETTFKNMVQIIQQQLSNDQQQISQYIFKPVNSILFNYEANQLFDVKYHHLEYFPMINQRVFQIGQQSGSSEDFKDILNVEFKKTYANFLHIMLHQTSLNDKHRLQLSYFLQLQDRVEEAIQVFSGLNLQDSIVFDYMQAYYEFFSNEVNLAKVKAIVEKYQQYPVEHLRIPFKKIQEQLDEIENANRAPEDLISPDQDKEITDEQKRQAQLRTKSKTPIIHSIKVDSKGNLDIDLQNITELTVKYYLIDAEILFSRSPFVKDEAKQFSFVKPFLKKTHTSNLASISMPEELLGKNVVIEVNSDDLQEFRTFYSSELKVQVNEKFGELRVYHKEKPLSKVYVKVFCKNQAGTENFYRDGFTDIRGKFDYANASGKSLNDIKKFAILVCDDNHGSLIKEADIPKKQ